MTARDRSHGQYGHEILDHPIRRNDLARRRQKDHTDDTDNRKSDTELEFLEHLGHLDEEIGKLGFLGGGAPGHVDFEHVREQGLGHVEGQAAEEDAEHEDPFEVFEDCGTERGQLRGVREKDGTRKLTSIAKRPLADTIAHDGQGDVAQTVEDDDDGEPDFPRIDVILVEVAIEPTDGKVVGSRHDPRSADSVVSTDIGNNGNLRREADIREQKLPKEFRERTPIRPLTEGMEKKFVATIGVFLPPSKLVINGKRDTFLETLASPSRETDNIAIALETKGHVEILRDVGFGPELVVAVLILVGDLLDSSPTKDSVMADERRDVAVGDGVADSSIDKVGEEGDAVLEIGVDDLHDAGGELHDAHVGGELHLGGGIEDAVGGDTGVGVNQNDVVAHPDVAIGPGDAALVDDFLEAALVGYGFVVLGPVLGALDRKELFLHIAGDHEAEVHV